MAHNALTSLRQTSLSCTNFTAFPQPLPSYLSSFRIVLQRQPLLRPSHLPSFPLVFSSALVLQNPQDPFSGRAKRYPSSVLDNIIQLFLFSICRSLSVIENLVNNNSPDAGSMEYAWEVFCDPIRSFFFILTHEAVQIRHCVCVV